VGCTALLIASKYEEIYVPALKDFVYIGDKAYVKEQIIAMEGIILNTLAFNFTVPSPLRFSERFLKITKADDITTKFAYYLMELTLQNYDFLNYLPSVIAASAVYLARLALKQTPWPEELQYESEYSEGDLKSCVSLLYGIASQDVVLIKYKAVRKKYSTKKMEEVNKIIPAKPHFIH